MLIMKSFGVLVVLGGFFGSVLAFASQKFSVEVDSRVSEILEVLPGVNCGGCGFPGCSAFADAIVEGKAMTNACVAANSDVFKKISKIMGEDEEPETERKVVRLRCSYPLEEAKKLYLYEGIKDCHLLVGMFKGHKLCDYGCFGLGSCSKACPFGAITKNVIGLPEINYDLCTGCGICVNECPQSLLYIEKISQNILISCNNLDFGKKAKDVCPVACISCGLCAKLCPENAITMVTYKNGGVSPRLDSEKCIQCGICVEKCPSRCIKIDAVISGELSVLKSRKTGCSSCGLCDNN